ncbi:MAG: hypothetical protein ACLFQK_11700 [Fibrobacterota bacterium]
MSEFRNIEMLLKNKGPVSAPDTLWPAVKRKLAVQKYIKVSVFAIAAAIIIGVFTLTPFTSGSGNEICAENYDTLSTFLNGLFSPVFSELETDSAVFSTEYSNIDFSGIDTIYTKDYFEVFRIYFPDYF